MTFTPTTEEATEHELDEPLPVFVYGTLRPNCGTDTLWRGIGFDWHDGNATVDGYRLVSNGAFPYMIPAEGEAVIGAVIVSAPDTWREMLARMDQLEGVPVHYKRIQVSVNVPGGTLWAWTYTPPVPERFEHLRSVPSNDWNSESSPVRWFER